ncbi:Zn(2)-C6 fungal-type domain-containing protein [Mycena venus]|uniref:Zn(2)-C6 fungal-type domain-containing protein n=1 Tax=Mycena venus TaxID=2733690 RepID=A0A8H7D7I4_9AGAR|nr:Zn(2)-C6 fungal-type domain-containing protein [Mycena venus]
MIIYDETEPGSSKLAAAPAATLRLPDPVAGRSSVSSIQLPDYETSQAQVNEQQHHSNSSTTTLASSFRKPSLPHRFDSRFWRITFFALAIYVFLSVVVGIPIIVTRIKFRQAHQPPPPDIQSLFLDENDDAAPPYNSPFGTGMVMAASSLQCDTWDSKDTLPGGRFIATARHTLSPDGMFAVRSNVTDEVVPHPGGMHNLTVAVNDDASERDVLLVVSLTTSSVQLRDQAHYCFSSAGDGRGLAVYMPRGLSPTDVQVFDIRLLFPKNPSGPAGTSHSANLVTYLPMFHQYFAPLNDRINIDTINIAGAGLDVVCDDMRANKIAVKMSYANINGMFNASQSLKLDNIQGSITANATLYNDPSTQLPTYLYMDTGNSDLMATVTMVSSKPSLAPKFNLALQTFNGSLMLDAGYDAATQGGQLMLSAQNNQGMSTVYVDKKFTGLFDLHTKLSSATLDYSRVLNASSGSGSNKQQGWHFVGDSNSTYWAQGWVGTGTRPKYWDPSKDGKVSVVSSLSPIKLEIVP